MADASLREHVAGAARILADAGVSSPDHDARELAAFVLGEPRLPVGDASPPAGFVVAFAELVARRADREPLQLIIGAAPFRYLNIETANGVFIPRPETEVVAQAAIDEARRGGNALVVDLCCGTGAIALAVATEVADATVVAVDVSPAAVDLARRNADAVDRGGMRIDLEDAADPMALADLNGGVDVVVSNPPYIPPDAVPVEREVLDWDPDVALYGRGSDGLEIPTGVAATAFRLLKPGGLLVMEHADTQGEAVRATVESLGMVDAETRQDLTGRDRFVVARRPGPVKH